MPWFWDLVTMSSHIPLCLPNLLTEPFNQTPHRNLSNLNLHAWLLEPQQSRSGASLRQWQHESRFLKEDQPDQSMKQSGPFLQSGDSVIRWTSGHPYIVNSGLPFVPVPGQEVTAKYRSAIADKLLNMPTNVSKDENLTRLLDSFHRGRHKGSEGHLLLEPLPGIAPADKGSIRTN